MSAISRDRLGQHGGDAVWAAGHEKGDGRKQNGEARSCSSGSAQIASVVLPFLEKAKSDLHDPELRLDYGIRKFDVATGENWSVYFRLVNTKSQKTSHYYTINLSSRSPLIIMADSLDVGSTVRRREICDEAVQLHDDITDQTLAKLLDHAADEAGQA